MQSHFSRASRFGRFHLLLSLLLPLLAAPACGAPASRVDPPAGPAQAVSMPLKDWKPANPRIRWNGPVGHEPRDSELMVALMDFPDRRAKDSAALRDFFPGLPGGKGWKDSTAVFGRWLLDEKRRLKEQVFHVDFYHAWPAYDARRGGFPLDVLEANSCGYFDNFRGVTPDGVYSFDLGKHVEATGMPTRFFLPMERDRAVALAALRNPQGKLLLRVYFRFAGISRRPCEPGGELLRWSRLRVLRYEVYPPPPAWGEGPDPVRLLAFYPAR